MARISVGLVPVILAVCLSARAAGDPDKPLTLLPSATRIVLGEKPGDNDMQNAARTLQTWLRKIYRASEGFEIVHEPNLGDPGGKTILALGQTHWIEPSEIAGLWRDGFVLKRKAGVIVIAGGQTRGTLHGAIDFLDRVCGVRFYMPTDRFTSLPAGRKVEVAGLEVRSEPYVKSCFMSGTVAIPGDGGWLARNAGNRRLGGTHQHSMFQVFPPEKYAQKYPEIYPILKGQRYIPQDAKDQAWQPCFSEPKLLDAAEETALAHFQANPEDLYLAYSVQDGRAICQCPRCTAAYETHRAADPKAFAERGASLLYWTFMNTLAERLEKKLPGKYILGLAYGPTRFPPPFKLRSNIIVFCNHHIAELIADHILTPGPNGPAGLDEWLAVASSYGNHDWYHGSGYYLPRIYSGFWSQYMRQLKSKGAGTFMHTEVYPNWGLDGPKYYILGRLWWNPESDVAALLAQFCRDMFGPAAEPMREYFTRLENLWTVLDNQKGPERKLNRWSTQFKTDEADRAELRQCRALLDEASGKATTKLEKDRIELFSKTFRWSEYLFEFAAADTIPPARVEEARKYAREVIAPDPMTVQRHLPGELESAIDGVVRGKRGK